MDNAVLLLSGAMAVLFAVGFFFLLAPAGWEGSVAGGAVKAQRQRMAARLTGDQRHMLDVLELPPVAVFTAAWQSTLGFGAVGALAGYIFLGGTAGLLLAAPGAIYGWVAGQSSVWQRYSRWQREVDTGLEGLVRYMPIFLALRDTPLVALRKAQDYLEGPARKEVERLTGGIDREGAGVALGVFAKRINTSLARSIATRLSLRWAEGLDAAMFDSLREEIARQKALAHSKGTANRKLAGTATMMLAILPMAAIIGYPWFIQASAMLGGGG